MKSKSKPLYLIHNINPAENQGVAVSGVGIDVGGMSVANNASFRPGGLNNVGDRVSINSNCNSTAGCGAATASNDSNTD